MYSKNKISFAILLTLSTALICGSRELTIDLDENQINVIVNELRKCLKPIIETATNCSEEVANEWKCQLEDE